MSETELRKHFHCTDCEAAFMWYCHGLHTGKLPCEKQGTPTFCPRCGGFDCVKPGLKHAQLEEA